eukprot:c2189_g1_i1.p1 GENE.c2189_g1_i1~~c2189_g1_i1.p1  ORF type:complete len:175 (+),score=30.10 c2189_g1_i1:36-527(+)
MPSKIREYLFLGGGHDAQSKQTLQKYGITHILNVADDVRLYFPNEYKCLHLPVADFNQDVGISRVFAPAHEFVAAMLKENPANKVLVHCMAGMNRSPTVTMALLMLLENISLRDAVIAVSSARALYLDQNNRIELIKFEENHFGRTTITLDDFSTSGYFAVLR